MLKLFIYTINFLGNFLDNIYQIMYNICNTILLVGKMASNEKCGL